MGRIEIVSSQSNSTQQTSSRRVRKKTFKRRTNKLALFIYELFAKKIDLLMKSLLFSAFYIDDDDDNEHKHGNDAEHDRYDVRYPGN